MGDITEFKGGKGKIGKIHERPKETDVVKKFLGFNKKIYEMGISKGKPQSSTELAQRFSDYFDLCLQEGVNPTVERTSDFVLVMLEAL